MAKELFASDWVKFITALLLLLLVITSLNVIRKQLQRDVLARVNGEPIYDEDTTNATLYTAITQTLLKQAAQRRNITTTPREVRAAITNAAEEQGLTREQFLNVLQQRGASLKEIRDNARTSLQIQKLFDTIVNVTVISEDVQNYYNKNKKEFIQPVKVEVRQVNCADCTYNITQDTPLPSAFKQQVFNATPGSTLSYSNKTIIKIKTYPRRIQSLNAVRKEIRSLLERRQRQQQIQQYITMLRANASIHNYVLDKRIRDQRNWSCIRTNATLYGARWDSQTQAQLRQLGNITQHVQYIECSGASFNTPRCKQAGITAFPTWVINGKHYLGLQSRQRLYQLACE